MSSKINLQTCEYACKSSIFQDNQLISLTQSILKEETIHTHREIVNCIAAHDEQGAYNAMKKHIDDNQRCAKKMIQK